MAEPGGCSYCRSRVPTSHALFAVSALMVTGAGLPVVFVGTGVHVVPFLRTVRMWAGLAQGWRSRPVIRRRPPRRTAWRATQRRLPRPGVPGGTQYCLRGPVRAIWAGLAPSRRRIAGWGRTPVFARVDRVWARTVP